jgi:hypothetical protein
MAMGSMIDAHFFMSSGFEFNLPNDIGQRGVRLMASPRPRQAGASFDCKNSSPSSPALIA